MSESNYGQHGNEGPEHSKKSVAPENARRTSKVPRREFHRLTGDACIMTGACGWAWS
jgi:hypothetical protein